MPPWAAGSPALPPSGQAHLHLCFQNQLYWATQSRSGGLLFQGLQPASCWASSFIVKAPLSCSSGDMQELFNCHWGTGPALLLPHVARGEVGKASPPCPLYFYQTRDGVSSPAPAPPELALWCYPLKVQGLLSHVLQLVRSRAISLGPVSRGNMRHGPLPLNSHRCRHPLHICAL